MSHKSGPDWKLDRRDSGRLFWRRDSATSVLPAAATPSPMDRVKFRHDVEVLEFWETEDDDDDVTEEEEEEDDVRRERKRDGIAMRETSLAESVFVCVLCVVVLLGTIVYQWWSGK